MTLMRSRCVLQLTVAILPVLALATERCHAVVSTSISGLNVNTFLGADRFYAAGFTGSTAVAANIEAGYVWNGHAALSDVTTQLKSPLSTFSTSQLGSYDNHATMVGGMIAGKPVGAVIGDERARGLAYGATLWSGAIATVFYGNGNFDWDPSRTGNDAPFTYPYVTAMQTGVNGVKANVINSSWGGDGAPAGDTVYNFTIDGLANTNGTTVVFAAGNNAGPDSVNWPANGNNLLCVAALTPGSEGDPYSTVAGFSSRGPETFYNPVTHVTVPAVRAVISLAAPGDSLWGTSIGGQPNEFVGGIAGTSFAAPIVAGGAALIIDAGKQRFANNSWAIDGRVVKAVLMNSATKTADWNNGQTVGTDGVTRTTQGVDWVTGAGRMNLNAAFDQYLSGTTDLAGTSTTTALVKSTGWDFNTVAQNAPVNYLIAPKLLAGTMLTATLDWFVDRTYVGISASGTIDATDDSFDNLDLSLFRTDLGASPVLIAASVSVYDNVEHLYFQLPATGTYALRVTWTGELYDVTHDANQELFALAWSATSAAQLPGDFNGDGRVDAADYTVWADTFGAAGQGLSADGNGDGVVDAADYTVWANHFGATTPGGIAVVPEPTAILPLALATLAAGGRRQRR